jgi:uncharacterized protein YaaQ
MKMILAILRDEDNERVTHGLLTQGLRVTRIASTGGWMRRGNTTLMIGVDDGQVDPAIEIIRENCQAVVEAGQHRATLFVLNVAQYEHL